MTVYFIRRLLQAVVVLFVVSVLVFTGVFAIGDPVKLLIDPRASADEIRPGTGEPRSGPSAVRAVRPFRLLGRKGRFRQILHPQRPGIEAHPGALPGHLRAGFLRHRDDGAHRHSFRHVGRAQTRFLVRKADSLRLYSRFQHALLLGGYSPGDVLQHPPGLAAHHGARGKPFRSWA